ncbi:ribosome biogenesis factor YjgA [Alteromonas gilva]|uniref:Dual-action ribosomal maturation protein DarP n=1 Tax=Alteromonas gilva TaxID=2987522 RepID=A0ABT5L1K3_9ALTE|nr:ribosome biogenesis factor YjgA [Alteromonas gilva]MDC8829747.1 ribosome biogenesis factor YjgA [Alteromonas gilva]
MNDPSQNDDANWDNNDSYPDQDEFVSKSELKRQSALCQKIGEQLVNLSDAHLKTIPLDDELAGAIALANKINRKKDGFRRQLQFIGKLMRNRDLAPIEAGLAKLQNQHQAQNARFHQLEKTRDAIADKGDTAIQQALDAYPTLERQKLRQYHRAINKERAKNAPPKAYRELFQYLKEHTTDQD